MVQGGSKKKNKSPLFPGGIETKKRAKHANKHSSIASVTFLRHTQPSSPVAEGQHRGQMGQLLTAFTDVLSDLGQWCNIGLFWYSNAIRTAVGGSGDYVLKGLQKRS